MDCEGQQYCVSYCQTVVQGDGVQQMGSSTSDISFYFAIVRAVEQYFNREAVVSEREW